MKMFNPVMVGQTKAQETAGGPEEVTDPHSHRNLSLLERLSLDENGVLMFDDKPVDTVGQQFVNASILEQFSVVDNKLYFAGTPVDTAGSVFDNDAVLRLFSQSEGGTLLFNGQPIEGGSGTSLPNADDLKRLAIDENGQLTVDGVIVQGSGGAVTLSVTKLGTGTSLVKGFVGSDLQTRSLVAGTNMAFDVTGDEIKLNATLSGAVTASTTFKSSDEYNASHVVSNSASSQLQYTEAVSETGLLFLARLGADAKASLKDVALPSSGSVTPNSAVTALAGGIGTVFNNGKLSIPNGTTVSDTSPATWFAGTGDWTIEFDVVRSTSNQGIWQNIVAGWNGSVADSSVWISFSTLNEVMVTAGVGSVIVRATSSITITDTKKHHIEATRSGGFLRIFIDGALVGSTAISGSINAGTGGFAIGTAFNGAESFYGALRNVKIYNYAKHTASYTVPTYYADLVSTVNTITMSGKMLASAFWKQISSLSVSSTETATAYLKWLMLDANGVWTWDTANKVWVTADTANVHTGGMTTAELIAALTNNQWNYRSDVIGFVVALITTDGATTPVLTSLTLNAVQSADKTAGHSVLNSQGDALPQRTKLKFIGMQVSDDGETTTVTGATTSEELSHKGASLSTVVEQLVQNSGHIGDIPVDVSAATNGSVLVYSAAEAKFVAATQSSAAAGSGLYVTAPFTLAAGEERTVSHQTVVGGRAMYQVDQVISGAALVQKNRMLEVSDLDSITDVEVSRVAVRSVGRLPTHHQAAAYSAVANMPIGSAGSCSYTVDDYIYWIPTIGANWASLTTIYKAHVSDPTSWTSTGDTVSLPWPTGGRVFRYKDTLFMFSGGRFVTANVATPTKWSAVATHASAPPINSSGAFLVGDKFYIVAGWTGAGYSNAIYYVDLAAGFGSAWTLAATRFPISVGRCCSYQYNGFLYMVGGETSLDTVCTSNIYRASVSDPTAWTQIGSYPVACAVNGTCAVKNGKVFIAGGKQPTNSLTSVYMADAANPVSWTALTSLPAQRFFVGIIELWDGFIVAGGMQGTSVATVYATAYKYTLSALTDKQSGTMEMAQVNTSLIQSVTDCKVLANVPSGTAVKSAVRFDGVWSKYVGGSWVACASMDEALSGGADLVGVSGISFSVAGMQDLPLNATNICVALKLLGSASATPEIYSVEYTYIGRDMYSPLLVTGYTSSIGDIGLTHSQGDYSSTNIKNKTAESMTVVVKVCDGYAG